MAVRNVFSSGEGYTLRHCQSFLVHDKKQEANNSSSNRMFSANSFFQNRHRVGVDDEYPMPMDHPSSLGSSSSSSSYVVLGFLIFRVERIFGVSNFGNLVKSYFYI
jgi:hypothetical protein